MKQFVSPTDIPIMKLHQISPCFSPEWFQTTHESAADLASLGPERFDKQYIVKDILTAGVNVCFGSDWPVTSFHPYEAIELAVTRRSWDPEYRDFTFALHQKISVKQAVMAYTMGGAKGNDAIERVAFLEESAIRTKSLKIALGIENSVGSIEKGKVADLIILNQNIFEIAPEKIHETCADAVIIEGEIVKGLK